VFRGRRALAYALGRRLGFVKQFFKFLIFVFLFEVFDFFFEFFFSFGPFFAF
jgi:hypothetical protein